MRISDWSSDVCAFGKRAFEPAQQKGVARVEQNDLQYGECTERMDILNMSRRTGSGMRPRSALRDRGAGHGFRSLRDAVPDTRVMVAPLARPHGGSKRQDIARMRKLHPCIGVRARTGQLLLK